MEESSLENVIRFLAVTEQCKRTYLSVIVQGVSWIAALVAATATTRLFPGTLDRIEVIVLLFIVGAVYFLARRLVVDNLNYAQRYNDEENTFIKVLTALFLLLLIVLNTWQNFDGSNYALILLVAPILRRVSLLGLRIGKVTLITILAVLSTALLVLVLYMDIYSYIVLLVLADVVLVATSAKRMIHCGEEAIRELLGTRVTRKR